MQLSPIDSFVITSLEHLLFQDTGSHPHLSIEDVARSVQNIAKLHELGPATYEHTPPFSFYKNLMKPLYPETLTSSHTCLYNNHKHPLHLKASNPNQKVSTLSSHSLSLFNIRILKLISLFRISFYQFQGKENSLGKTKRTIL